MQENRPKVGVGLLILRGSQILLGKRKGSHGAEEYGSAGGHVEHGETMEQAALRELAEECGIRVKNLRFLCVSDLLTYLPKHYIDVGFVAEWESGEPQVLEPEKLESWDWYDIDSLPKKLFGPMPAYIKAYKTGQQHFVLGSKEADGSSEPVLEYGEAKA